MLQDSELCQDNEGVLVRRTFLFVSGDTCGLAHTTLVGGGEEANAYLLLCHMHNYVALLIKME